MFSDGGQVLFSIMDLDAAQFVLIKVSAHKVASRKWVFNVHDATGAFCMILLFKKAFLVQEGFELISTLL